jgi:hypothetical protein
MYPMNTNTFIQSQIRALDILFYHKFPSLGIEMSMTFTTEFSIIVGIQILGPNT